MVCKLFLPFHFKINVTLLLSLLCHVIDYAHQIGDTHSQILWRYPINIVMVLVVFLFLSVPEPVYTAEIKLYIDTCTRHVTFMTTLSAVNAVVKVVDENKKIVVTFPLPLLPPLCRPTFPICCKVLSWTAR